MNIFYRVSPFPQNNKPPIYENDKYKLVELCHNSFLKALSGTEKIFYLLDRCEEWKHLFKESGTVIPYIGEGRGYSITKMFECARENISDKLFFVEDDYFWRSNTIKLIEEALNSFNLVSPYDHPDHYNNWPTQQLKNINNVIYRECFSNTHTFATNKQFFLDNFETFKIGYWDHPMFEKLPEHIWQPTYSFATHMVEGLLAPNINWQKYF